MKIYYVIFLVILGCVGGIEKKDCLCFEVKEPESISVERPISINLNKKENTCWDQEMILIKKSETGTQVLSYQADTAQPNKIWFKHKSNTETQIRYCFTHQKKQNTVPLFQGQKENGDFKIVHQGQALMHYRYKLKSVPEGVNPLYQKSAYIHPVISPKGDTLTRIQPPDHYHHYGIWGPWTRTRIDNVGVDFWNLKDGQGTVLFKAFNNTESGKVYGGFSAHQEHLKISQNQRQLALNENLKVKVWKNNNPNQYFIDYSTQFSSPLKNGILFEAYRYGGGLGFRFKEQWNKDNCKVITSEGKNRITADGTSAKWCMVYGVSSDGIGESGVLFMSHPNNQSHPEPMRVWPLEANQGRGDMFFQFCPIRHKEWKIEPQQSYELNYRMLVFDGAISPEEAEEHWKAFALPFKINLLNN